MPHFKTPDGASWIEWEWSHEPSQLIQPESLRWHFSPEGADEVFRKMVTQNERFHLMGGDFATDIRHAYEGILQVMEWMQMEYDPALNFDLPGFVYPEVPKGTRF